MEMTLEATRRVFERYMGRDADDVSMLAPDVVYRIMGTGVEHHTPEGVRAMLSRLYHFTIRGQGELRQLLVTEGHVAMEGTVVGEHIGEFAGVPATGKQVRVPIAVFYDVVDDHIVEARVYLEESAFLEQVTEGR